MTQVRTDGRGGFTLVEVLVSLALVGAILPAAMAGVALAMGLGSASLHRTQAAALARTRLAEVTATGDWQEGGDDGDFGEDWPNYSWQMQVDDWEEPGLKEVTVAVTWTARGKKRSVTMATLAYAGTD